MISPDPQYAALWDRLRDVANAETMRLVGNLPLQIRTQIMSIPIIFEETPSAPLVADGVDPDVMGLFVGDDFPRGSTDSGPTEIFLFLLNIWDEAGEDITAYRAEVRKTLLHEWGHYLGLDEHELSERGLA